MSLSVRPFHSSDAGAWDSLCEGALQATVLHTRRYLGYHGNRFADRSVVIEENGKLVGLFPAALHPTDLACVVSHPGITYGGILHAGRLRGERMMEALKAICDHYRHDGICELQYKAVPYFYHASPSQDDLYALFRLGAARTRCDLSSTIDLSNRQPASQRRRRSLKKARKLGVEIVEGTHLLPSFWEVLSHNLRSKHGVSPVHSLAEITLLADTFPEFVGCVCATFSEEVVAGIVLFKTATTHHAQYIGSSRIGRGNCALELVFEHGIESAIQQGKHWFDFGISTEKEGSVLNEGLYKFKCEFGGGGAVHEFYELSLNAVKMGIESV